MKYSVCAGNAYHSSCEFTVFTILIRKSCSIKNTSNLLITFPIIAPLKPGSSSFDIKAQINRLILYRDSGIQKFCFHTIFQMDKWLEKYAALAEKKCTKINANQAGTGAAGGLGFAFLSFTNAVLESGIKIVLEETSLEKYMENADIVITGEGRLDGQTAMGKAPVGVARLAKKHNIPVTAFAGSVTKEAIACNQNGIDAFFPILRGVTTLEDAMKPENAKANMADTVEQVFRLLNIRRK